MTITYPTTLDTLPNPTSTDLLENATTALDHDQQHSNANDAIEALEAKVGINSSAVNTSHDYKLSEVATGEKAVSKTASQTLTNKTLTAPQINMGNDATGDMYYRNATGTTTRLPVGTAGQIIQASSTGIPEYISNPSAADASTTVKGVVEIATTAQIIAGTGAGETGALLVVPASAVGAVGNSKLVQFTAAGLYPAADGSAITNVTNSAIYKLGNATHDLSTTTANTIAHGLGKIPKYIKIIARLAQASDGSDFALILSEGAYNGTTQNCSYLAVDTNTKYYASNVDANNIIRIGKSGGGVANGDGQTAVATFDATNITLTWSNINAGTAGTAAIFWEAYA